jgi:hypothetical protein
MTGLHRAYLKVALELLCSSNINLSRAGKSIWYDMFKLTNQSVISSHQAFNIKAAK